MTSGPTSPNPLPPAARPASSIPTLAGLALLAASLLLIATDWLRLEAAVARCDRAGLAFDRAAGRCEEEPVAVAFLALAILVEREPEPSLRPPHPGPLPPLRHASR
jgi:hypothetical protein